jgi:glycosyltransferase involved in cell wall biosynthesis
MNRVILFTIPHLYGGGAERVVSLWASQLAQTRRYDVHILVSGRVSDEYAVDENVTISSISPTYEDYEKLSLLTKLRRRRFLLKRINPDYVISFLPHIQIQTFLATIGLKTKRVETIRVSPWVIRLGGINRALWNLCINTCHALILQTAEQGLFFSSRARKKSIVIPNPINDIYNHSFKCSQSELVRSFMAAGRITPQKNFTMMIRAFAKVHRHNPNITLDIFGGVESHEYKVAIEDLIHSLGLENNVRLCGRSNNIHEEYIKHDAFLMSSDCEGMPNSLLEAMVCGMVCLSTNCKTGPKDMIEHGDSGFLVQVDNADEYANGIEHILQMSQAERQLMGERARKKIIAMCSPENTLKQLIRIFE